LKIDECLCLIPHRRLGVAVAHGDYNEGKEHRIQDSDDGKFESGDLVVEA
jgi:hypothetical protein